MNTQSLATNQQIESIFLSGSAICWIAPFNVGNILF